MLYSPYYLHYLRNRLGRLMDPLSDVPSLLEPGSYMCGGFDTSAGSFNPFSRYEGIKCYAVVSGQCWLSVEGVPDAVRLNSGDCFLLPRGWPWKRGETRDSKLKHY